VIGTVRFRTTIVLAAVALLLGSGYYLYEVRGREARELARAAERRVLHFAPEAVREITIEKPNERVVVRAEGGAWRIVAPVEEPADAPTVEGLLAFVRGLEKVRALERSADLAAYGLDAPPIRLALSLVSGERLTLLLAALNPAATGVYATVKGAPVVFLAPRRLGAELAKTPYLDELRDKTLLPVDPERVRRIEIARADARIVVERTGERRWQVKRPFDGPGDDGIIRDLLWKVGSARAHTVIRGPAPPARYGLDRPQARLVVVDDRGVRGLTVARPGTDPGEQLYVSVDGLRAVHVAESQLLVDLAIAPDALRNRQLLVYDQREVERIAIRYPNDVLLLQREGDGWRVTKPVAGEAARATVENLLEVLPNLRYSTMEPRPSRDLSHYGLDRPRLAVTVGLRGGRELPTLAVGRQEAGQHFVMVGGAPPVYTVDARLIRVIPEDPTDAKRYPLPEQLRRGWEKLERGKS
jgi:hypothetical protein